MVSSLLRHHILFASHRSFLPCRGTDTANLQVIGALKTTINQVKSLNCSSWDIYKALYSNTKPLIRLAWRCLELPPDIAEWLMQLDLGFRTFFRSEYTYKKWLRQGITGLTG